MTLWCAMHADAQTIADRRQILTRSTQATALEY